MRLAEIEVGGVYAMANYYEREHARLEDRGRLERREWDRAWNELAAVRVLEVGVPLGGYRRPGVLVQHLDRGTLEPRREPTAVRYESSPSTAALTSRMSCAAHEPPHGAAQRAEAAAAVASDKDVTVRAVTRRGREGA